eukprot:980762-Pleurochrysis_carterae.AAC.1
MAQDARRYWVYARICAARDVLHLLLRCACKWLMLKRRLSEGSVACADTILAGAFFSKRSSRPRTSCGSRSVDVFIGCLFSCAAKTSRARGTHVALNALKDESATSSPSRLSADS